ncbi:cyclic di-GMP phosphodiesterase [Noviherbaspirillum saxi]|uniref:Cyclic di-GMP phosphodiesterase n=1 Tax=Noviherbaspirillum saxi TaxID=2320863 RepID=A0A3A3FMR0_9BURK|nr:cyclic di-GMP phosphodiesterase [Noviherbaspirillum saxi]RJF92812.1 cyclic di-GMP phosphodiesterase [Noviherbaspirillum saxi]
MDTENTPNSLLFTHFGTYNPYWWLSSDSDALKLSQNTQSSSRAIRLSPEQASQVRALLGITACLRLEVMLFDDPITLYLVGRKVDAWTWAGTASDYRDIDSLANCLSQGIAYSEQVVSEVNSLVVIIDSNGKIKRFNRLCEEVTGFKEENVVGHDAHDLFMPDTEHEEARANIKEFFKSKKPFDIVRPVNGKYGIRQILWRNKIVESGSGVNENYLICSGTDITEERRVKARLLELANNDVLTGLPNRHAIQEAIASATSRSDEIPFAVLFIDLDNFKKVNDYYGHLIGDELIKAAALAIRSCLREGDTIARLGGDEFLVVIHDATPQGVESITKRVIERMKEPFYVNYVELYATCSIGIALFPDHGKSMEELVRHADMAMYAAKEEGRNTYRLFALDMNEKVSKFVWLDTNLRKAISEGQFELHYQPKKNLKTGKTESVEALIRWNSPERGLISPLEFIPYAEESGLIVPLGKWVMEEAARQAGKWKQQGLKIRIAINLSARQLRSPELINEFKKALLRENIFPSMLDLELTESCLIEDELLALNLIKEFSDLGAEVHLDDFGTGYSSLSHLARLPIDSIKLDRSFIHSIHNDIRAQRLLRSMVAVAQELELQVVAEGVETQDQLEFLRGIGVDHAQGYLFAKPMRVAELEVWMTHSSTLKSVA